MSTPLTPAFLRGNLDGYTSLTSSWVRGLESTQEQIAKWTAGLSPEGFWWEPVPGANSIGGLVNHIGITILRLAHFAKGQELPLDIQKSAPEQLAPTSEAPEAVVGRCNAAIEQAKEWLKTVSEAELEQVRVLKGRGEAPALHLWHKLVEHSHEHVGQIITLRKLWDGRQS